MFRAAPNELKVAAELSAITIQTSDGPPSEISAKIMNQIRKWSCHFDGKDPVTFMEQVEELKAAYGCTGL